MTINFLDNKFINGMLHNRVPDCVRYTIVLYLLFLYLCIVFPLFYLYRALVVFFVKYFKRSELANILDPKSCMFVDYGFFENAPTCSNMVCVLELKGKLTKQRLMKLFEQHVLNATVNNSDSNSLKYPELKMYPCSYMGYWFWKYESPFKTEDHIKEYRQKTWTPPLSLSAIHQLILNDPLPENKSPWDITLFKNEIGYTKAHITTFVAVRMHHSLGDAKSLIKLISQNTVGTAALPEPEWPSGEIPRWYPWLILLSPFTTVRSILERLSAPKLSANHPWQLQNPGSDSSRFIVEFSREFAVGKLKAAAGKHGNICFSAVLLAAVTGAARSFVEICRQNCGNNSRLSIALALSKPNHPENLANHFEDAVVKAPTDISCYKERLRQCQRICMDAKNVSEDAQSLSLLENSLQFLVRPLRERMKFTSNHIATFTNLTGETEGFSIGEFPCKNFSFSTSPLRGSVGVSFAVMSYRGRFRFTVVANESVMTETECGILTSLLEQAFFQLD